MAYTSVAALFTAICNSIRAKLGTTNPIAHQDIPSSIDAIVTGEGGADVSGVTATAADVRNTVKFVDSAGVLKDGTMPNIGAQTTDISAKATTVVPTAGYHNGSGAIKIATAEQDKIVTGNIKSGVTILGVAGATNVVDTTNAVNSATNATLLSEKKAFVNGESLTGTMPNIGQQRVDISAKATSVIPSKGYHNGAGAIKIATAEQDKIISGNIKSGVTILGVAGATNVVDTSSGTANEAQLLIGNKAWVDGEELTGTMTNVGAQMGTISTVAGTVTPTQGYHNGLGSISIHTNEQAKIIAGNIKSGVTLLGVTGSLSSGTDTSDATATAADIRDGYTAYADGDKLTGTDTGGFRGTPEIGNNTVMFASTAAEQILTDYYATYATFEISIAGAYRLRYSMIVTDTTHSTIAYAAVYQNDSREDEVAETPDRITHKYVDLTCEVGDTITLKGKVSSTSTPSYLVGARLCTSWDNGF